VKRSPELRDLSDDHHRALVLAKRARIAAAAGDPGAVAALWDEIGRQYDARLAPHFAIEETYLLPPVRDAGGDALARRVEADHAALRQALDGSHGRAALGAFADRLSGHVRFEERKLFPFAEATLPAASLLRIAAAHPAAQPRTHGEAS
jgi:hypothetical protein